MVLVLASLGARPALAADTDSPPAAADKPADAAATPVPQVQVDDEGPSTRVAKKVHHGFRVAPVVSEVEEKPFWKSWVFWIVTGVLVAGTVGAFVYSYSGNRGSAGPCPAGIQISLGCFGAGRM